MATTVTLSALRSSVRQRADMVNSQFITDAELNGYIQASYYELYDLLVEKYGDNYYVATPYSFSTDGTNYQFALPTDFFKLLGVDLQVSSGSGDYVTLHPFTFAERNRYAVPNQRSLYGVTNLRYKLNGNNLWLNPLPSSGQTVRVWYVPRATVPATDAATIDGISGWEEYVIVDAAIKCLQKEESDVSVLMAQKAQMRARIESIAANRDAANPATVADSSDYGLEWGEDF
jgi:hypothetical protein